MRNLLGALAAMLFSAVAYAQENKPVQLPGPLADYVSFCLALWTNAPDVQAKASALGLQDGFGAQGMRITLGKSTMQLYKAQGNQTVIATTTLFSDGKGLSCDVSLPVAVNRTDLETMEKSLHLDGQIMTLGPAVIGHWKMPNRQPAVLLRALVGKAAVTIGMQQYEAAAKDATQRH